MKAPDEMPIKDLESKVRNILQDFRRRNDYPLTKAVPDIMNLLQPIEQPAEKEQPQSAVTDKRYYPAMSPKPQEEITDTMIEFILEIDSLTTTEFCKKYNVPLPVFTGEIKSSADQFLQIDAIKQKMFVEYAKQLSRSQMTANRREVVIPNWYTKEDLYNDLRRNNYSEEIAEELSQKYADDLQHAFTKGWEKAKYELNK
jgi:hypothetical protein